MTNGYKEVKKEEDVPWYIFPLGSKKEKFWSWFPITGSAISASKTAVYFDDHKYVAGSLMALITAVSILGDISLIGVPARLVIKGGTKVLDKMGTKAVQKIVEKGAQETVKKGIIRNVMKKVGDVGKAGVKKAVDAGKYVRNELLDLDGEVFKFLKEAYKYANKIGKISPGGRLMAHGANAPFYVSAAVLDMARNILKGGGWSVRQVWKGVKEMPFGIGLQSIAARKVGGNMGEILSKKKEENSSAPHKNQSKHFNPGKTQYDVVKKNKEEQLAKYYKAIEEILKEEKALDNEINEVKEKVKDAYWKGGKKGVWELLSNKITLENGTEITFEKDGLLKIMKSIE